MPAANNTTPAEIKTRLLDLMDDILATGSTGAYNELPEITEAYNSLYKAYIAINGDAFRRE